MVRQVKVRLGSFGGSWYGRVYYGEVRLGGVCSGSRGEAWSGSLRFVEVGHVEKRRGLLWQSRHGRVRPVGARIVAAVEACYGKFG